jgi:hypothetical protein
MEQKCSSLKPPWLFSLSPCKRIGAVERYGRGISAALKKVNPECYNKKIEIRQICSHKERMPINIFEKSAYPFYSFIRLHTETADSVTMEKYRVKENVG